MTSIKLGIWIKDIQDSKKFNVDGLVFIGTWATHNGGYKLISIKFQCIKCGAVQDSTKECEHKGL